MPEKNSRIEWPKTLSAHQGMCYESLELLFERSNPEDFAEHMAFALSCSRLVNDSSQSQACIHKLEITAAPDFANSKMKVTHEVLPGQGNCVQIISMNDKLRVAGFNSGAVIPIKGFGPRKTFNCDVRGRLVHHESPVTCLSRSADGYLMASGSTGGEVAIYPINGEEISFLTRRQLSSTPIAGLAFFRPPFDVPFPQANVTVSPADALVAYATCDGRIGIIDPRCELGSNLISRSFMASEPRRPYSSICIIANASTSIFYLGTLDGELLSIDFRNNRNFLQEQNLKEDDCIRKIVDVKVRDDRLQEKTFIAYTNESKEIKILDSTTWQPDARWICDRKPEAIQKGLCVVRDRIVTCGSKTSIGCWCWDEQKKSDS